MTRAIDRRALISTLALLPVLSRAFAPMAVSAQTSASSVVLPSWNDGPAKQAILDFVRDTTGPGSPKFVLPEDRIATFDQDGTLWVEHPVYGQMMYCFDRVSVLAEQKPELKNEEPLKPYSQGTGRQLPSFLCGTLRKSFSLRSAA
ncbi:MAG: family hydrolase [Bradyrhizobium sp.]|nr:family hydrolase [Bradyrhizobium sp.]